MAGNAGISGDLTVGGTTQISSDLTIGGTSTKLNNVVYNWPSSQGSADTMLTNNGSGGLSWAGKLPSVCTLYAHAASWTNMSAAETEFGGSTLQRIKVDLTNATQAQLTVRVTVAGATNAEMRLQYSTDENSWYYLDGSTGPGVNISSVGTKVSSWDNITAGAKADVFIRGVGINGDGVIDPQFGDITMQVR